MKLKSNDFETVQFFIIFYKQNHLRNATKFLFILLFFNRSQFSARFFATNLIE